ncbi:ferredoxin [Moraxella macacae 0408225]|uniref:Epoxyqueuosine reductase n=1 Tax=Moraxella macacae 0408225 TaxID=1230338 RepID=L2F702_9GAMM|nr:tRNA epoxyqueuosine(34) reductase QueG [Moraxella macacae]ELA08228.1 ferredoxin [Moraxella macacae 0408225]
MKIPTKTLDNSDNANLDNTNTLTILKHWIKEQALDLGFSDCGVVHPDNPIFPQQLAKLKQWLADGYHGNMNFFHENHDKRANPALLVAGTKSILSVRLDYLVTPPPKRSIPDNDYPNHAIIARYARGRDYHKIMRSRLKALALRIHDKLKTDYPQFADDFVFRPFSDSAPISERPLAEQAGLGWTGKHTLLINQKSGSFFVLGELFTSLPLPADSPVLPHCGSCSACMDICPTGAIVGEQLVDARRCISYLTIELDSEIPLELRPKMGNKIFGCDDCQLVCPWNKFAKLAKIDDFNPRHNLDSSSLLDLWGWDNAIFLANTEGSPLRRTGYDNFMRNIAVALGNAPFDQNIVDKLKQKYPTLSENAQIHIDWAIKQQLAKAKLT